jgi:ABC-2 type transport system permease protein
MTSWMPWKIAKNEFRIIRRKKSILAYVVGLPILLSLAFSLLVQSDVAGGGISSASLGLESLTYIFVIFAAVLPTSIAAYSIVGEKVEKSLEPLLATPTTDTELLLGKAVGAFLPPILTTWAGASIFMAISDYLTFDTFSYYYFPNWLSGITLFLLAPLASILGIEVAVILSARVSDVRGANQLAGLMWIPFMVVFIGGIQGTIPFTVPNLLIVSGIVLFADIVLFFLSKATFNREEILTKWK